MEHFNPKPEEKTYSKNGDFNARFYMSEDKEFILTKLPGDVFIRKHVNFYKKLMGIPYTPKALTPKTEGRWTVEDSSPSIEN